MQEEEYTLYFDPFYMERQEFGLRVIWNFFDTYDPFKPVEIAEFIQWSNNESINNINALLYKNYTDSLDSNKISTLDDRTHHILLQLSIFLCIVHPRGLMDTTLFHLAYWYRTHSYKDMGHRLGNIYGTTLETLGIPSFLQETGTVIERFFKDIDKRLYNAHRVHLTTLLPGYERWDMEYRHQEYSNIRRIHELVSCLNAAILDTFGYPLIELLRTSSKHKVNARIKLDDIRQDDAKRTFRDLTESHRFRESSFNTNT